MAERSPVKVGTRVEEHARVEIREPAPGVGVMLRKAGGEYGFLAELEWVLTNGRLLGTRLRVYAGSTWTMTMSETLGNTIVLTEDGASRRDWDQGWRDLRWIPFPVNQHAGERDLAVTLRLACRCEKTS
ncbi:hypothetical protein FRC08_012689 [Ceratobasidium sp. 394]|nr:hypothetical protein FRC08_012689 [Ceratobasidium sp. 394]